MPPQQLITFFPFGAVVGWCGVRGGKSGLILHWMSKNLQVSNAPTSWSRIEADHCQLSNSLLISYSLTTNQNVRRRGGDNY